LNSFGVLHSDAVASSYLLVFSRQARIMTLIDIPTSMRRLLMLVLLAAVARRGLHSSTFQLNVSAFCGIGVHLGVI
jgi:hypothetical protein